MRANYSPEQVERFVLEYEALAERADTDTRGGRLDLVLQLTDFRRALEQLSQKYYEAVLLHGLIGLPQRAAAELLQISQPAVSKRYRKGIEELHWLINGGTD